MGYNFTSSVSDIMKKEKSGELLLAGLCPNDSLNWVGVQKNGSLYKTGLKSSITSNY